MEINNDEVRRQLVESQREHAESLPRFREMLKRLFDQDRGVSDEAKTALLGLPNRRSFLTFGGVAVASSAVLVACATPKKKQLSVSGPAEVAGSTTTTAPGSAERDLVLLRTAQSIEVLAVATYDTAINSGLLTTPSVLEAITLFRSQHADHSSALTTAIQGAGGDPFETANPFLDIEIVQPAIAAAKTQTQLVALATILEDTAAETYTLGGGVLTTVELRQAALSIGATEARHLTVLYGVQNLSPVPLPFMPTRKSAPKGSYIGSDGKTAAEPVAATTTTATAAP
ncbi:MAG: ferritin-like domain-containing protein [Actinomycetes bacterium]